MLQSWFSCYSVFIYMYCIAALVFKTLVKIKNCQLLIPSSIPSKLSTAVQAFMKTLSKLAIVKHFTDLGTCEKARPVNTGSWKHVSETFDCGKKIPDPGCDLNPSHMQSRLFLTTLKSLSQDKKVFRSPVAKHMHIKKHAEPGRLK